MKSITYKESGVDIDLGDECSKIMYEASRRTWNYRSDLFGTIGSDNFHFAALRYISLPLDTDLVVGLNSDGIGTKVELAERLGNHNSMAFDLFAMVCDDAAIRGAEPVILASVLDCSKLDLDVIEQLAAGMTEAASICRVCVLNGEIAELGKRVSGYIEGSYNWSATVVWIAKRSRLLRRTLVQPGMSIVAVREKGIRSNGISLIRKILSKNFGDKWHTTVEGNEILKWAILPSIIYTPLLVSLTGGYSHEPEAKIAAAIHITGGGIPGKLGRLLSQANLGANLDNLFPPPQGLIELQKLGNVSDEECYRTWNMGQGLLIVCAEPLHVIQLAVNHGYEAQIAGKIIQEQQLTIKSQAFKHPNEIIKYAYK